MSAQSQVLRRKSRAAIPLSLAVLTALLGIQMIAAPRSHNTVGTQQGLRSATFTVKSLRLYEDGRPPTKGGPDSAFRIEQSLVDGKWKTVFTVITREPLPGAIPGSEIGAIVPQVGLRIEDGGDGSPIKAYNAAGKQIRLPSSAAGRPLSRGPSSLLPKALFAADLPDGASPERVAGAWLDNLLVRSDAVQSRALAIRDRYGDALSRVRTLDRYMSVNGDKAVELLVDPGTALPVEMNITVQGRRDLHVLNLYSAFDSQTLFRSATTVERALVEPGERLQIATTVSDVNIPRSGGAQ